MLSRSRLSSRRCVLSEHSTLHRFDDDHDVLDVRRTSGSISLEPLNSLHYYWASHKDSWQKPEESDRWLAPRVHYALRLTRSEASDRETWHWLARNSWADYVRWRWSDGGKKEIAAD